MLIRLFAALYLTVGVSALIGMMIIFKLEKIIPDQNFQIWGPSFVTYSAFYGAVSLFGGIGLLLMSKTIAHFAAKR